MWQCTSSTWGDIHGVTHCFPIVIKLKGQTTKKTFRNEYTIVVVLFFGYELFPPLPLQRVDWEHARMWEGKKPGWLAQTVQRDIPNHMMSCSAPKAWGKEKEGGYLCLLHLSSQEIVMCAEALLPRNWEEHLPACGKQ